MTELTKINIACGNTFLQGWRNFDYASSSPYVTRLNSLERLPLDNNKADVVYSSHFLEHIPRPMVDAFMSECFRITKPGGILRLVLPDFEELCAAYLQYRQHEEHDKAEFLQMEILDQCVRQVSGGELGEFYKSLEATKASEQELIKFVQQRTGHVLEDGSNPAGSRWQRLISNPGAIIQKLENIYIKVILRLLPPAFRQQNVSLAAVGERHAWVYDYYNVKKLLFRAGFIEVKRLTATTSNIPDFPFYPLDIYKDGTPRKGAESMYIEARKP